MLPVLVLLVGVAAAGAGYWQMQREAPLSQGEAQDAADAAASAVEKVLSFDYRDLDAYESGVEGLLTDAYVSDELEPSIAALRELNALGYGDESRGLTLNLVYNPQGPVLPPPQGRSS